jgi:hypothetical protein
MATRDRQRRDPYRFDWRTVYLVQDATRRYFVRADTEAKARCYLPPHLATAPLDAVRYDHPEARTREEIAPPPKAWWVLHLADGTRRRCEADAIRIGRANRLDVVRATPRTEENAHAG